jgi:hypothetical protein
MLNENLDIFLDDFARVATLDGVETRVIFDSNYLEMGFGAEGRSITALGKSSRLSNARHGDPITIDGKTYTIVGVRPQGDGAFTELELKE